MISSLFRNQKLVLGAIGLLTAMVLVSNDVILIGSATITALAMLTLAEIYKHRDELGDAEDAI